jgi:hypothetical protein
LVVLPSEVLGETFRVLVPSTTAGVPIATHGYSFPLFPVFSFNGFILDSRSARRNVPSLKLVRSETAPKAAQPSWARILAFFADSGKGKATLGTRPLSVTYRALVLDSSVDSCFASHSPNATKGIRPNAEGNRERKEWKCS